MTNMKTVLSEKDDLIYIIGGFNGDLRQKNCYKFDVKKQEFAEIAPLNKEANRHHAFIYGGEIHVLSKARNHNTLHNKYIIAKNEWIQNAVELPSRAKRYSFTVLAV